MKKPKLTKKEVIEENTFESEFFGFCQIIILSLFIYHVCYTSILYHSLLSLIINHIISLILFVLAVSALEELADNSRYKKVTKYYIDDKEVEFK